MIFYFDFSSRLSELPLRTVAYFTKILFLKQQQDNNSNSVGNLEKNFLLQEDKLQPGKTQPLGKLHALWCKAKLSCAIMVLDSEGPVCCTQTQIWSQYHIPANMIVSPGLL